MKSAVDQFLNYLRSVRNASPHTLRSYENDLSQFLAFLTPPGRRTAAAPGHHAPADSRICGAPARSQSGKILDCPQAGRDPFLLQICRAGRAGRAEPGAHGGDSQAAEKNSVGPERRRFEHVSGRRGGHATRPLPRAASAPAPETKIACWSSATARFSNCSMLPGCASAN